MNPKWLKLAGALLRRACQEFSNHGCNDWLWPDDFTPADRLALVTAMHEANLGKPVARFTALEREDMEADVRGAHGPADWWLMAFLGKELLATAERQSPLQAPVGGDDEKEAQLTAKTPARLKKGTPVRYAQARARHAPWVVEHYYGNGVYRIGTATEFCDMVPRHMLTPILPPGNKKPR